MSEFTVIQENILRKYERAIVHMRKRNADSKFSLVFGAGASVDFEIPKWDSLINEIASDRKVNGSRILKSNMRHSSRTQVLFHHYAAKLIHIKGNSRLDLGEVKNQWRNIVRKHLYKNRKKVEKRKNCFGHPYLAAYMPIIKNSPMTITYNFDDYIEQILQKNSTDSRIYETIWDPRLQAKSNKCVIYHPNGFLPRNEMERQSDGLVFCEDEFADQLIESMAGRYASLLHHYSQNTCLFIGLSLDDDTLKHLLRQSARLNPGHYHYYVAHQKDSSTKTTIDQKAIFEANFNLYNLITLFLTNNEIKELGNLINMPNDIFIRKASPNFILTFCFYVVGAIGAGKSTVISHFRNLFTHDEWPDFRIPELGKDWKSLTKAQKYKVDNWIAKQFQKKNSMLCNTPESVMGMHIIDRAPLDPIAFTNHNERSNKAAFLLKNICIDEIHKIKNGHIIFLYGDPDILEERAKCSGKSYKTNQLKQMQEDIKKIYASRNGGMTIVHTKNKSLDKIIKEVGNIIHNNEYKEINLHLRANNIKEGKYRC